MPTFSRTSEYANLTLSKDKQHVAPGDSFNLTVSPTLTSGATRFRPAATYKLFVRLPKGLKKQSVSVAPKKNSKINFETSWDGAPGEYGDIPVTWDEGSSDRAKDAYQRWLLATWTTSDTTAGFNASLDNPLGWTINIVVDGSHDSSPANMDAILIVSQNGEKDPLEVPISIQITAAGPEFASVTFPAADTSSGNIVLATTNAPVTVRATLANGATAAKMKARWQVEGAGTFWNQTDPPEVAVIGGIGKTTLADFAIQHDFTQSETLLFSVAAAGQAEDLWGAPFKVKVDFVADLLAVADPVIKTDSAKAKVILTCTVREPSSVVKFSKLTISVDGGKNWSDITSAANRTGTSPSYSFSYETPVRDFSQGVLLGATDNLGRTQQQPVLFDAATFLTVQWFDDPANNNDINLGEQVLYAIYLQCKPEVVLPTSTVDLLLSSAVDAVPARGYGYFAEDTFEVLLTVASGWLGKSSATTLFTGPIESGGIYATGRVAADSSLLGNLLPAAKLIISSKHFLNPRLEYNETTTAKVFRPAPAFQLVNPPQKANQNAVSLRGDFTPSIEASPDLVFSVSVDKGTAKTVRPDPSQLTGNGFTLALDYRIFKEFEKDGSYNITVTVHRSADTRAAGRSSYSVTHVLEISNAAAAFEDTYVQVDKGNLRLEGYVIEPATNNKVKEVTIDWDGTGEAMHPRTMTLTDEGGGRYSFSDLLPLNQFKGTLRPVVLAVTESGQPTPQNLLFSTAEDLLVPVLKFTHSTSVSNIANSTTPVSVVAGTYTFELTVTSTVGLHQKINMYLRLGEAFSASEVTSVSQPASGQGSVTDLASWDGNSQSHIVQTEGLEQNASFTITGTTTLSKVDVANMKKAQTISIQFFEPDQTQHTISAPNPEDGEVFTAQLVPQ